MLVFSLLDSQTTFGILLATTIVTALVADFLLMPALVLTVPSLRAGGSGGAGGRGPLRGRLRDALPWGFVPVR